MLCFGLCFLSFFLTHAKNKPVFVLFLFPFTSHLLEHTSSSPSHPSNSHRTPIQSQIRTLPLLPLLPPSLPSLLLPPPTPSPSLPSSPSPSTRTTQHLLHIRSKKVSGRRPSFLLGAPTRVDRLRDQLRREESVTISRRHIFVDIKKRVDVHCCCCFF